MYVGTYGILRIIKTLEFFQHYFSEMGHRDLLVTQTYLNRQAQLLRSSREASAARRLCSNELTGKLLPVLTAQLCLVCFLISRSRGLPIAGAFEGWR